MMRAFNLRLFLLVFGGKLININQQNSFERKFYAFVESFQVNIVYDCCLMPFTHLFELRSANYRSVWIFMYGVKAHRYDVPIDKIVDLKIFS